MVIDIYYVIEHAKYGYVSSYSKDQGFSYNKLACAMTFEALHEIEKLFQYIEDKIANKRELNEFEIKIKIRKV